MIDKLERINQVKAKLGSRNDRKLKRYSESFNKMFSFYLSIYRSGLITFCGVNVDAINGNSSGIEGKYAFREYDNGRYSNGIPSLRHPNILRAVIIGKKGWGLWLNVWAEGVADCTFTKEEILNQFTAYNIDIPEPLLEDFNNRVNVLKIKRNEQYREKLIKIYENY
jgi:hypothetical protein